MNIFWFRRDLRLEDSAGLHHALLAGNVLPIFIFDSNILSELPRDDARLTFIHDLLEKINKQLLGLDSKLAVFHGDPEQVISTLIANHTISSVYANRDYEPYARLRDDAIGTLPSGKNIGFNLFKDQVIFEQEDIVKPDHTPYVVYSPYAKKWREKLSTNDYQAYQTGSDGKFVQHDYPFLSLADIRFTKSNITVPEFDISADTINQYVANRNFPASGRTSSLSPHLRFGAISIRQIVEKALQSTDSTFLSELIWREFFMQILWHFPQTVTASFRPKYDNIKWRNDEVEFKEWCSGQTGYPIVDAGMRELNATGLMHNRVRMIVASFLCKHLLIDWRWGEAYFALKLLDYEQASNVGNWQWAAGSGVDAAPYFRIFNPSEQVKKFDRELKYIKKWVPELETFDYPNPIVDHKVARERCLQTYKDALTD